MKKIYQRNKILIFQLIIKTENCLKIYALLKN